MKTKLIGLLLIAALAAGALLLASDVRINTAVQAQPKPKEFQMMAVEWKATLGKADPYPTIIDRGVKELKEGGTINHYTWDPNFIVVNKGDSIVLKIHGVNGNVHDIDIAGIDLKITGRTGIDGKGKAPIAKKPEIFTRGELITVEFKADQAGLFEILCTIHDEGYASKDRPELKDDAGVVLDGAKKKGDAVKGPMVGYLLVLP